MPLGKMTSTDIILTEHTVAHSDWLWAGRSGDRIPVGVRFSASVQNGPGTHPALCTMGTESFLGVNGGQGRAIPLLPLWAVRPVQSLSACTRVHFAQLLNNIVCRSSTQTYASQRKHAKHKVGFFKPIYNARLSLRRSA